MERYDSLITIANDYFAIKDYQKAATEFTSAFNTLDGKGMAWDRYQAAKAFCRIEEKDTAFYHLNRLLEKTDYLDYPALIKEQDFILLHDDERWKNLLTALNPHNEKYDDSLAAVLEQIYNDDQKYRKASDTIREKFGYDSKEYNDLHDTRLMQDSINLIRVIQVIDSFGWLSENEVGKKGNTTFWLVIQHAPPAVQEKYLPVMQHAVENGKASKKHLAYLQDRILMHQGKKQLYGTQYQTDFITNTTKMWEVEDPENLNKRRESVGLPPVNLSE